MAVIVLRTLVLVACFSPLVLSATLSSGEEVAAFVRGKIENTQVRRCSFRMQGITPEEEYACLAKYVDSKPFPIFIMSPPPLDGSF